MMNNALENTAIVQTNYGTVHYERGFEIVEIAGWIEVGAVFIYVCGDASRPAQQQPHTALLVTRIVEIEYIVADV